VEYQKYLYSTYFYNKREKTCRGEEDCGRWGEEVWRQEDCVRRGAKIIEALKGKKRSTDHRAKICEAKTGKKHTEEKLRQ
jgi:hypothetical protein